MNLEANVEIGDFRIERRLGAGGMGIVYLARQLSLNRPVALKVLGSALTAQTDIARFQREAHAVAKLNHPGIAGVYFIGQDRDICYLAMEYVDGMSLRELMRKLVSSELHAHPIDDILQATSTGGDAPEVRYDGPTQPYPPDHPANDGLLSGGSTAEKVKRLISSSDYIRRCCEIIRDAALALAHAHERGVIHRDIKPENILLGREGKPHVIDFGLARFYEDVTVTNTGALVGTPMYMSPEQVTGRLKIDHRTDIYSLGFVLYEMLTLHKPFESPTREGILRQIVTKSMVPVGWKNRAVPRDLENVVHQATSKDADERYQSASALVDDLERFLEGNPTTAPTYHYKFDATALTAERPPRVTAVSFVLLAMSFYHLFLFLRHPNNIFLRDFQDAFYCAFFLIIGIGIRNGYNIIRLITIPCMILLYLNSIFYMERYIDYVFLFPPIGPVLWEVLDTGFQIFLILTLTNRRTVKWFGLAAQMRAEHKQRRTSA